MSDESLVGGISRDDSMVQVNISTEEMHSWSEPKRHEFVRLYKQRQRIAQQLLFMTARSVQSIAIAKKFLGADRTVSIPAPPRTCWHNQEAEEGTIDRQGNYYGRPWEELERIAGERAEGILRELPPVKKALQLVLPDIVELMDQVEALKKKGQALHDKYTALVEPIEVRELDQSMTLGDFRKLLSTREDDADKTLRELRKISDEAQGIQRSIDKRLYRGIPEIGPAVEKVIKAYVERGQALSELGRRVEERVLFGDNAAAVELLQQFEKDEVQVSDGVKAEFASALSALKLRKAQLAPKKGAGRKGAK